MTVRRAAGRMRGRPFIAGDPRTVACSRQGCAVGHQQALVRHALGLTTARKRARKRPIMAIVKSWLRRSIVCRFLLTAVI